MSCSAVSAPTLTCASRTSRQVSFLGGPRCYTRVQLKADVGQQISQEAAHGAGSHNILSMDMLTTAIWPFQSLLQGLGTYMRLRLSICMQC